MVLQVSQATFLPWMSTLLACQPRLSNHPGLPYPALMAGFAHEIVLLHVLVLLRGLATMARAARTAGFVWDQLENLRWLEP